MSAENIQVQENGGKSPVPKSDTDEPAQKNPMQELPKSVQEVLSRNKGHDIAKRTLAADRDYSKATTLAKLKAVLTQRDDDLITISQQFLSQERRINSIRLQVQSKNREMAKLRQETKDASDRAIRYADALVSSVDQEPSDVKPGPSVPEPDKEPDDDGGNTPSAPNSVPASPNPDQNKTDEHSSVFQYSEYKDKIRALNLEELNMVAEADAMIAADDCNVIEDEPFRYSVPPQVMGLLIGRQKVTLKRIINQTATEIEPLSWVVDGQRLMGFELLGSTEAIKKAISIMIRTVRNMDKTRAKRIIAGHINTADRNDGRRDPDRSDPSRRPRDDDSPRRRPRDDDSGSKSKPHKSKSNKACWQFNKGHCPNGNYCRFQHIKKGKK